MKQCGRIKYAHIMIASVSAKYIHTKGFDIMASPVVVSRIQNRRGTQVQFDGYVYSPSGPNSVYPNGYNGIGGYNNFPNFNSTNYPNVLLPGELAFCTDSRRIFLGNLNGEYVEVAEVSPLPEEFLKPSIWVLPPSATFVPVTTTVPGPPPGFLPITINLEYQATPFFNIIYDITDSMLPDWNSVGINFSKNGELKITAVADFAPIPNPPFPDITSVTLTDTGTEINLVQPADIQFIAQYNGTNIQILYKHDFAGPLTLSVNTIAWLPFI